MPVPDAVESPNAPPRTAWRGSRITIDLVPVVAADGSTVLREIVRHPGGAVILPRLDDGRIVLIRNHRVAVGETLWELPAGTRGPGEDLLDVARRELEEETGYRAERLAPFGSFFTTPGFTDERIDAFLADGLSAGPQHLDDGESIEVAPRSLDEVLAMIDDGRIRDAKTIVVVLRWWRLGEADR